MSRAIDTSGLPQPLIDAIEAMVRAYREKPMVPAQPRPIGWAKGIVPELPDSFFEDLPPDVLDQFDGRTT